MSATVRGHLAVVQDDTGEVQAGCAECAPIVEALRVQLQGAETEIKAWRVRYENLSRDKDAEAREHPLWPVAVELFDLWKKETGHTRSRFGRPRFEQVRRLLKEYGRRPCEMAIIGIAMFPERNRETGEAYNGWQTVFADEGRLEKYANRCPKERRPVEREPDKQDGQIAMAT